MLPTKDDNPLKREKISPALSALLKHFENVKRQLTKKKSTPLFEEDDSIYVIIALKRIPDHGSAKPIPLTIPHPLYNQETEICIFVKDPQKEYKKKFIEQNVKVAKVIGLSKLRSNYKPFEAKRQLCNSYDLFLTDSSILHYLPKLLGKTFFKKKRQPIPIDLNQKNPTKEIERVLNSTFLYLTGGACCAIRIGRTSFSLEDLVDNVLEVTYSAVQKIPKKWKNIQSLHIKTSNSLALPIYSAVPLNTSNIEIENKSAANTHEDKSILSSDSLHNIDDSNNNIRNKNDVTAHRKDKKNMGGSSNGKEKHLSIEKRKRKSSIKGAMIVENTPKQKRKKSDSN